MHVYVIKTGGSRGPSMVHAVTDTEAYALALVRKWISERYDSEEWSKLAPSGIGWSARCDIYYISIQPWEVLSAPKPTECFDCDSEAEYLVHNQSFIFDIEVCAVHAAERVAVKGSTIGRIDKK